MTKTVVVIGGGATGITAAYQLQKQGMSPIILEKTSRLGGMCSTYREGSQAMTERGAVLVAPNYPILSDMRTLGIRPQKKVAVQALSEGAYLQSLHFFDPRKHWFVARFLLQHIRYYLKDVHRYKKIRARQGELPEQFKQPFADYLVERGIDTGLDAFRALLPGCGYGPFERIPTWLVFEYLGYFTILSSAPPGLGLKVVEGGYQNLFEKMAATIDHQLNVDVIEIKRHAGGVEIVYDQAGQTYQITADQLLLAIPPNQWPSLGLSLTDIEQQCTDELQSISYPVIIARIKQMPKAFIFFSDALYADGFNQVGLITTRDTRDNPDEGRISTIYLNIDDTFDQTLLTNHAALKPWLEEQIRTEVENAEVDIIEVKNWDYFRHLDWSLRNALQACQGNLNTFYAGAYLSFEDVACVSESAQETVRHMSDCPTPSKWQRLKTGVRNTLFFYHPAGHKETSEASTMSPSVD